MKINIPCSISYGQVVVFLKHLPRPGLIWTRDDHEQGFAWDDGIAAFAIPDHDGDCLIVVNTDAALPDTELDEALWAIAVPFHVTEPEVEIGTILNETTCEFETGSYQLRFEVVSGREIERIEYAYLLRMLFFKEANPVFSILKRGPLTTDHVLKERATRA